MSSLNNQPDIIGISGYARAGKDSVADVLAEFGYEVVYFATLLRKAVEILNPIVGTMLGQPIRYTEALAIYGYETLKDHEQFGPEVRRLLQAMGTNVGRNLLGQDIWVDALMRGLRSSRGRCRYVIPDMRFPNEFRAVAQANGLAGLTIRVVRPGVGPANGHESETALDEVPHDFILNNDGTLGDLQKKVHLLMQRAKTEGWGPI